jgi:ACS family tartrate transporter-like MFS transporter
MWLTPAEKTFVVTAIQTEGGTKDSNLARAFCDPRVLLLGIAYVGVFAFPTGLYLWLPLRLQAMGFSNQAAGLMVAFFNMAGVPGMILWARSSDRRGDRVWHFALAALFAAAALILASITQSDAVRLLAFTVATIGASAMMSPFFSLPALFLSGRALAGGFALISATGILFGGFAGQYAIGVIREQTGSFGTVFAALSAALLVSALIVVALGRAMSPRRLSVYGEAA